MVALANNSDKSSHPQEDSKIQKEPFFKKIAHNFAIIAPIKNFFVLSCDSASNDVLIIVFKTMGDQKKQTNGFIVLHN